MSRKKLSTLLATALMGTCAAPAFAVIDNYASGNGELFFNVVDSSGTPVSFFLDLAPIAASASMASFTLNHMLPTGANAVSGFPAPGTVVAPGTRFSWTINSSTPGWSDFVSTASLADLQSWRWNVVAGDRLGATTSTANQTHRYLTTSKAEQSLVGTTGRQQLINFQLTEPYITAANFAGGGSAGPADASGTVLDGPNTEAGYFGEGFQNNWFTQAPFDSTAGVGESQMFYMLFNRPTSAGAAAGVIKFENPVGPATWTFAQVADTNDFALTYAAPVPEPEQWAMMVAGLALVGALARRRRA